MFSFYGRKTRIVDQYPAPAFDTIIEPFAGSAAYSLAYADHAVQLYDVDEKIVSVWRYLIAATPLDILALPLLEAANDNVDQHQQLSDAERYLIGFFINPGSAQPKKSPTRRSQWNPARRATVAAQVEKVSHWTITKGSYQDVPNQEATWFIDPPYAGRGGYYYRFNNKKLNYGELAEFCRNRDGQVIVCENDEADWLPFQPLCSLNGMRHKTKEIIWTNGRHHRSACPLETEGTHQQEDWKDQAG